MIQKYVCIMLQQTFLKKKRHLFRAQVQYNNAHVKSRAIVKCFGWWKRRFMVPHEEIRVSPCTSLLMKIIGYLKWHEKGNGYDMYMKNAIHKITGRYLSKPGSSISIPGRYVNPPVYQYTLK